MRKNDVKTPEKIDLRRGFRIKGFVVLNEGARNTFYGLFGAFEWARFYRSAKLARMDSPARFGYGVHPATITVHVPKKKEGGKK